MTKVFFLFIENVSFLFLFSELLRQSVVDNQQQQIHLRKREDAHQQTKRKYEDLYKAYNRLKDQLSK